VEEIKMFSGWFHHERVGLCVAQANQAAVEEANEWLRKNETTQIVNRSVHVSAGFLTITVWWRPAR
jgi:hypothetical protein